MGKSMVLEEILAAKCEEVSRAKKEIPLARLEAEISSLPHTRDLTGALTKPPLAIIAEIKRSSPSKGRIRDCFDPVAIAKEYEAAGAAAISVLTDERFFEGKGLYLKQVKEKTSIPVLRKDFIIDPYQLYETRWLGGDGVLLITAILKRELADYIRIATAIGLTPLVEVHTEQELEVALAAGGEVIGINNRDLYTFSTNIRTTLALAPLIPEGKFVVAESGIATRGDIELLLECGVHCFLIGEALMRSEDIGGKLRELLGGGRLDPGKDLWDHQ